MPEQQRQSKQQGNNKKTIKNNQKRFRTMPKQQKQSKNNPKTIKNNRGLDLIFYPL